MYEINPADLRITSAKQFCNQVYSGNTKPVVFWDTCALLNIIRFIYREDPGDITTFESIKKIYAAIMNGSIYSISCESVIKEFNDNVDKAVSEIQGSISRTYTYFKNLVDVINDIDGSALTCSEICPRDLQQKLYQMVNDIIRKTSFISIDKTTTSNAHERVLQKKAPAGKKEEFKDCTIWEVMLSCFRQLNTKDVSKPKVFYTVNFEDFCYIENKKPKSFISTLLMEASMLNFKCCKSVFEVDAELAL